MVFSQLYGILSFKKVYILFYYSKGKTQSYWTLLKILPAVGNESLLAIPYLTLRNTFWQSTDPLRTDEKDKTKQN